MCNDFELNMHGNRLSLCEGMGMDCKERQAKVSSLAKATRE